MMRPTRLVCSLALCIAPFTHAFAEDDPPAETPAGGDETAPDDAPAAETPSESEEAPEEAPAAPPVEEAETTESAESTDDDAAESDASDAGNEAAEASEEDEGLGEAIESFAAGFADSQTRDLEKKSDGWFRPVIGGRWLPNGGGGATVLGFSGGSFQRLNNEESPVALGLTSRARYEGAIGDARGRVVKTDGRFTFDTNILRVEAGGGLEASRSLFETAPQLTGVLGAVADARVKVGIEKFNVMVAARPMWMLTGDRGVRTEGPVLGVGDELSHILGANFFILSATWTRTYTASGPIEQVIAGFEI